VAPALVPPGRQEKRLATGHLAFAGMLKVMAERWGLRRFGAKGAKAWL